MTRPRLPLLIRLVAILAATGLLPLAISYYQLRTNRDALFEQVQRTHIVASSTAAARADAYLEPLRDLARATASHPVLLSTPRSVSAQEILRGTLEAQPKVEAVGLWNPDGEVIVLAQRRDMAAELGDVYGGAGGPPVETVRGAGRRWLRLRAPLSGDAGEAILIADGEPLDEVVQAFQLGQEALLVLADRDGDVLFGGDVSLDEFPAAVVEQARAGKLDSGSKAYEDPRIEKLIVGHAKLREAPWFVLSRQPARIAEVAQERIRRATWVSALGAIFLTAVLSGGAYVTAIRPLRRLIAAQSQLAGEQAAPRGGSEIDQLEASFELLQQRIRDSEDLGQVFLGRYQVKRLVGSGAMGSVFEGWDPKLQRNLALKTIRINDDDVDPEKLMRSLLEEASISASFHHPNIVTVYDVADQGNAAFIAMEYVDGVTLEDYLNSQGPLAVDQAIPLGLAIARALVAAHERQLVHHDVKPANVLLGRDRSIKVTDFGISELITTASRSEDVICGTPGYIAPECFLGEPYTPQADLFALGIILYEALSGVHPFRGRTLRETILNSATVDPMPIAQLRPEVPAELGALIDAMMSKEPSERPPDAATVAAELEKMAKARNLTWTPEEFAQRRRYPADDKDKGHPPTQLVSLSRERPG